MTSHRREGRQTYDGEQQNGKGKNQETDRDAHVSSVLRRNQSIQQHGQELRRNEADGDPLEHVITLGSNGVDFLHRQKRFYGVHVFEVVNCAEERAPGCQESAAEEKMTPVQRVEVRQRRISVRFCPAARCDVQ